MVIYQTMSAKMSEKKDGTTCLTIWVISSQVYSSSFALVMIAWEVVALNRPCD
jgi:hypothetical protein